VHPGCHHVVGAIQFRLRRHIPHHWTTAVAVGVTALYALAAFFLRRTPSFMASGCNQIPPASSIAGGMWWSLRSGASADSAIGAQVAQIRAFVAGAASSYRCTRYGSRRCASCLCNHCLPALGGLLFSRALPGGISTTLPNLPSSLAVFLMPSGVSVPCGRLLRGRLCSIAPGAGHRRRIAQEVAWPRLWSVVLLSIKNICSADHSVWHVSLLASRAPLAVAALVTLSISSLCLDVGVLVPWF